MGQETVILAPGESAVVSFEATPTELGVYHVAVDGLEGSFAVTEPLGRLQGYILDEITDGKIPYATIYVDGVFNTQGYWDASYRTDYILFGPHIITVIADNYKTTDFEVLLQEPLQQVDFRLAPLEEIPGWPEDIEVTGIMVEPTAILGQDVDIGVLLWGPYPDVYPRSITGTITVDGATLTETIETSVRNPAIWFVYTPTETGIYTVTAKDKSATFEVLPGAVGVFHSPFGAIRTELHAMHIDVPAADPPYWTTIADLVQHMTYTTGSVCEVPGCYMVSWKDSMVRGSFHAFSGGTRFRCPHCDIWIEGDRHDYIGIMSKLLDHIEAVHPEFPLDRPPAGIVFYTTLYGRYQLFTGWLRTPGDYYVGQVFGYDWDIGTVTVPDYGSVVRVYLDERRIVTETWEERL